MGLYFFETTAGVSWAAVLEKVNGFDSCIFRSRDLRTTGARPDGFEFTTESESLIHRSDRYGMFIKRYHNDKPAYQR
ncbi:hypothetical protein ACFL3F_03480 [Planctomycetota bacterium]